MESNIYALEYFKPNDIDAVFTFISGKTSTVKSFRQRAWKCGYHTHQIRKIKLPINAKGMMQERYGRLEFAKFSGDE